MIIKYDRQKLSQIINSISALTGLSLCVIDTDFQTVYTKEKEEDAFCHKIQTTETGREKCRCSDEKMLRECAKTKAPVTHICHAGLVDTVLPVFKSSVLAAFIIIGRVRPATLPYPMPPEMKKDFKKLTYLTDRQLSGLIELLSHIVFENAISIEYDDFISKATEYIKNNIDKKLTVDGLCKALYVSKNYLYESFHDFFGCTVGEYITERKLEIAKENLCSNSLKISRLARSLGFENYAYFCKFFKKKTGLTPSQFRKKAIKP